MCVRATGTGNFTPTKIYVSGEMCKTKWFMQKQGIPINSENFSSPWTLSCVNPFTNQVKEILFITSVNNIVTD